jgi:hypothetical protein
VVVALAQGDTVILTENYSNGSKIKCVNPYGMTANDGGDSQ